MEKTETKIENPNDMQMSLYVIYDTITEQVSPIMEQINDKAAVRVFQNTAIPNKEDYELWHIGTRKAKTIEPAEPRIIILPEDKMGKILKAQFGENK